MAILTLLSDDQPRQYAAEPTATIGRLPDNTIIIDSPGVSGHHACVFSTDGQYTVEDLQSTNGTFVNGVRVSRQVLQHGDVVKVGDHELVLDRLAELGAPSTDGAETSAATEGGTVFIDRRNLFDRLVQSETEARKHGRAAGSVEGCRSACAIPARRRAGAAGQTRKAARGVRQFRSRRIRARRPHLRDWERQIEPRAAPRLVQAKSVRGDHPESAGLRGDGPRPGCPDQQPVGQRPS